MLGRHRVFSRFRRVGRRPQRLNLADRLAAEARNREPRGAVRLCFTIAMAQEHLTVALVRDVFVGDSAAARLTYCLAEARARGAELALLPELPLDACAVRSDVYARARQNLLSSDRPHQPRP